MFYDMLTVVQGPHYPSSLKFEVIVKGGVQQPTHYRPIKILLCVNYSIADILSKYRYCGAHSKFIWEKFNLS